MIFHAATKYKIEGETTTDKIDTAPDLLGALGFCDEHRTEVLEFVNNGSL